MKQLNCCAKKEQKYTPAESFINLYLRTAKVAVIFDLDPSVVE